MAKFHKTRQHDLLLGLLREARETAGLSQISLSRKLGHHDNYINRIELGRHSLDVINLIRILEAIGADQLAFFVRLVDTIERPTRA